MVYDPFMGSGTTAIGVLREGEGRSFLGTEISPNYKQMAEERISLELANQTLF